MGYSPGVTNSRTGLSEHCMHKQEAGRGHGVLFSSSSLSAIRVVPSASEVIDSSPGNLDSSLCFLQPSVSHDIFCI